MIESTKAFLLKGEFNKNNVHLLYNNVKYGTAKKGQVILHKDYILGNPVQPIYGNYVAIELLKIAEEINNGEWVFLSVEQSKDFVENYNLFKNGGIINQINNYNKSETELLTQKKLQDYINKHLKNESQRID